MSQQLQFELWRECNCKCTFCTLGEDNLFTKNELKLESIQTAINEISCLKKDEHETIGFIGGEFYQGQLSTPEVHDKFMEMIKLTNNTLNKGYIKSIWLNVSLLIGDQKDLYEAISYIDQKDKLWLLTSYDLLGRFHTEKMKSTWEYHMQKIYELYPQINRNTTSILTGKFIRAYLNDKVDLEEFRQKYHTAVFFKNPVKPAFYMKKTNREINEILGEFFPKRAEFLKFLKKFLFEEGIFEYDKLMDINLKADEVRKNYNTLDKHNLKFLRDRVKEIDLQEDEDEELLDCGHNDTCLSYCDSEKCIICDKKMIKRIYE